MDSILSVAGIIAKLVALGPTVIKGVDDARPFAEAIAKAFGGGTLTADEITLLEARIDALAAELQLPLPPAQPGDPDYVKPV